MSVIHIVPVLYFLVGSCNIIAVVALSCRCTYLSSSHTLLHPTPMCTPSPSPTTVGLHHATRAKHIVWVRDCACVCVCVCVCVFAREKGGGGCSCIFVTAWLISALARELHCSQFLHCIFNSNLYLPNLPIRNLLRPYFAYNCIIVCNLVSRQSMGLSKI